MGDLKLYNKMLFHRERDGKFNAVQWKSFSGAKVADTHEALELLMTGEYKVVTAIVPKYMQLCAVASVIFLDIAMISA